MNIFSKVFDVVFNTVFDVVFDIVLIVIFVYVFTNFTNTTTSKTRGFKATRFYFFPPTSERTHAFLASLSLLDFLLLPFLAFSSYCF